MTHASMLKIRRQRQKTRKLLDVAAKQGKRLATQESAVQAVRKERVKKEKVKRKSEVGQADPGRSKFDPMRKYRRAMCCP